MKRFKFKLEAVAKVRKIEMDEQAKNLALANRAVQKAKDELSQLERQFFDELARLKDLVAKKVSANQQLTELSVAFRDEIKRKAIVKRQEIHRLIRKVEEERLKLIEKRKKKKTMEHLEDQERERYEEELRQLETKIMDEISGYRHQRQHDHDPNLDP